MEVTVSIYRPREGDGRASESATTACQPRSIGPRSCCQDDEETHKAVCVRMKLKQFVVALAVRAVVLSHFVLAGSQTATYRVTLAPPHTASHWSHLKQQDAPSC
jgi:hypothetical protein